MTELDAPIGDASGERARHCVHAAKRLGRANCGFVVGEAFCRSRGAALFSASVSASVSDVAYAHALHIHVAANQYRNMSDTVCTPRPL